MTRISSGKAKGHAAPEVEKLPPDSPGRRRLPALLRQAWYGLNQAFRRRIAYSGFTPDQFTILRNLMESPSGLKQSELCKLMSSDPNTIASLLNRMEHAGLLERNTDEADRRAHRVLLLPKGKSVYHELRQVAVALQSEILLSLPQERREQFLADLELVADACSASKPPSAK